MSRRRRAEKRETTPDPRYGSGQLGRFAGRLMLNGKKSLAFRIIYGALDIVQKQTSKDPMQIMERAMKNVIPLLEVKPRRVGGQTYQIPLEVTAERGEALAFRWIIAAARSRQGSPMSNRLAQEILDASNGDGSATKRREDLHRMAEANRAFAHYRW